MLPRRNNAPAAPPEQRIQQLKKEIAELEARLGDRDPREIIQRHIKLLHTYNETKDGAQRLIGAYAQLTERTITGVHQELGLSLTE